MPIRRAGLGAILALAAAVAVVLVLGLAPSRASAQPCFGSSCLPGSGYTLDDSWTCGVLNPVSEACYANETKVLANAVMHTWGWGSAAYNGEGNTSVCLDVVNREETASYFDDCGTNIARACAEENCNDQDTEYWKMLVIDNELYAHTIWGHGKA